MIAEKQTKSNLGVGVGFVIAVVGRLMTAAGGSSHSSALTGLGYLVGIVGSGLFIWGCVNYAQGKGYSPWLGALGLLSCLGLIVLVVLPDKMKDGGFGGPGMGGPGGYTPPQPGVWPPPPGAVPPPAPPPGAAPPPSFGQPPGTLGSEPPPARKSLGGDDL